MKALLRRIRQILRDRRVRRVFTRFVSSIAAIVVFVTTYALVLPAITMESEALCGIPAHQHTDACYESVLICGQEESEGHHHTDDCYEITRELACGLTEHRHSVENGCYDEEGNLVCQIPEHTHDDTCYKENRKLVCGQEESEGHHHTDACYEKVLTCGMEAHVHSTECYREDSVAVAASTSAPAKIEEDTRFSENDQIGQQDETSLQYGDSVNAADDGNSSTSSTTAVTAADADYTDLSEDSAAAGTSADSAAAGTTAVLPEDLISTTQESLSDGYVPELEEISVEAILTGDTGFYYFHAEDGEDTPENSADTAHMDTMDVSENSADTAHMDTMDVPVNSADIAPADWHKLTKKTTLAPADLARVYFAYTIPAGSLNETNQVARYRMPANLHLTDDQILAINSNENGIAAGYIDPATDSVLPEDENNYRKYLGVEAVEGSRTPDKALKEGVQEYISATVKAENVYANMYDTDGNLRDESDWGEYLGQDLIFVFSPYTIRKNQTAYDAQGEPQAKGEKVTGWLTLDFNMDQIDWIQEEDDADLDNATVEKTAEIVFAEENKEGEIGQISELLHMTESADSKVSIDDAADVSSADMTVADATEAAAGTEKEPVEEDTDAESGQIVAGTSNDNDEAVVEKDADTAEESSTADDHKVATARDGAHTDGRLETIGDGYRITLVYKEDAKIPTNASLAVREITEDSDLESYQACLIQAQEEVAAPQKVQGGQMAKEDAPERTKVNAAATRFFDIEILVKEKDEEGNEVSRKIEPAAPVAVNIELSGDFATAGTSAVTASGDGEKEYAVPGEPSVLHFFEDGVEKIDAAVREPEGSADTGNGDEGATQIQFEANSFSVYGVVFTQIQRDYMTADGDTYSITVIYNDAAEIPDDADLKVEEIPGGTDQYMGYLGYSTQELGLEASQVSFARFFDIEIVDGEGNKLEPEAPVQVRIEYKEAVGANDNLQIVHFADNGPEVIEDLDVSDDGKEITYIQSGFSVTGTIASGAAATGSKYMLIVTYNNQQYMVTNNGTLVSVKEYQAGASVTVESALLWTYDQNNGTHLMHETEARTYTSGAVAETYYYRYIDPTQPNGIREERNADGERDYSDVTKLQTISNAGDFFITSEDGKYYIAVTEDEDGNLHLTSTDKQNEAVHVAMGTISKETIPDVSPANHTVSHIDISIAGTSEVQVPLAYGTYYYKDADGYIHEYVVNTATSVDLKKDVPITKEDLENAQITAYKMVNGERVPVNDAYYVSGFSSNLAYGESTVQVRMEGSFKVADLEPFIPVRSYNWWGVDEGYNPSNIMQQRLQNRIYYNVATTKSIPFTVQDTEHGVLYTDPECSQQIDINVNVTLSASFDYWDERNECPPIAWFTWTWRQGGIYDFGNQFVSGMDFVLGGNADTESAKIVALEITKYIVDENGHLIKTEKATSNSFEVFGKKNGNPNEVRNLDVGVYDGNPIPTNGYSSVHSRDVSVGKDGMGTVYDYDITPGMYYITEDESSIEQTIRGSVGNGETKDWHYDHTRIETEYVWRDNEYNGMRHVADGYVSVPEVVGSYNSDKNEHQYNGFLEYYVYNYYSSSDKVNELEVKKEWDGGVQEDAVIDVTLRRYKLVDKNDERQGADRAPTVPSDKAVTMKYVVDSNWSYTVRLTKEDTDWKKTLNAEEVPGLLKVDENGNNYMYFIDSVSEAGVAEGTAAVILTNADGSSRVYGGNHDDQLTVKNIAPKTVSGTKTWIGENGQEEDLTAHDNAQEVTLVLKRTTDGTNYEVVTGFTPTWNGKCYTFANLPPIDANGREYTYKVEEKLPANSDYSMSDDGSGNFTNSKAKGLRVTKEWKYNNGTVVADFEEPPEKTIYFKLAYSKDGNFYGYYPADYDQNAGENKGMIYSITWTEGVGWSTVNLPQLTDNKVKYYIVEVDKNGKKLQPSTEGKNNLSISYVKADGTVLDAGHAVDSNAQGTLTIKNMSKLTNLSVEKVWRENYNNIAEEKDIWFVLRRMVTDQNGQRDSSFPIETVEYFKMNTDTGWKYSFEDLPISPLTANYYQGQPHFYRYYVVELGTLKEEGVTPTDSNEKTLFDAIGDTEVRYAFKKGNNQFPVYNEQREDPLSTDTNVLLKTWELSAGKQATLGVFNYPKTYLNDFINIKKEWFERNSEGEWVPASNSDVNGLQVEFQLVQIATFIDKDGKQRTISCEYGSPVRVNKDQVVKNSDSYTMVKADGTNSGGAHALPNSDWAFYIPMVYNQGQLPAEGVYEYGGQFYTASFQYYFKEARVLDASGNDISSQWTWGSQQRESGNVKYTDIYNRRSSDLTLHKEWDGIGSEKVQELYFTIQDDQDTDVTELIAANPTLYGLTIADVDRIDYGNETGRAVIVLKRNGTSWSADTKKRIQNLDIVERGKVEETIGTTVSQFNEAWKELKYTVEEVAYKDNNNDIHDIYELIESSRQSKQKGKDWSSGDAPWVTIGQDGQAQFKFTNRLLTEYTKFTFDKQWYDTDPNTSVEWPADVTSITVNLTRKYTYRPVGASEDTTITEPVGTYTLSKTGDDSWSVNHDVLTAEDIDRGRTIQPYTFTLENLEKYVPESKFTGNVYPAGITDPEWDYELTEGNLTYGDGKQYVIKYYRNDQSGQGSADSSTQQAAPTSIDNGGKIENHKEPENGSLKLTKKVTGDGADQQKEFTFTVNLTAPAGSELASSYKTQKTGETEETLTLERTDSNTKASVTVTLKHGQTWEIKDLPINTLYAISETDYASVGYASSVTKGNASAVVAAGMATEIEYTNTYSVVNITIRKVEKGNDSKLLNNAVFQLYRKGAGGSYEVFENDAFAVVGTGTDVRKTGTFKVTSGTITISHLSIGEYKLHEVSPPSGCVITNSDTFFKVNNDKTITMTDEAGNEIEKTGDVQETVMVKHQNGTFTVRNEQGAALPSTGGPGTRMIYILGATMTVFAGALLFRRRRA